MGLLKDVAYVRELWRLGEAGGWVGAGWREGRGSGLCFVGVGGLRCENTERNIKSLSILRDYIDTTDEMR